MEQVENDPDVVEYLPDPIDLAKTPKQWIVNIVAAVAGQQFKNWVTHQVEERNAEMAEKRELMISMDPEMAQKFASSTHVSRKYIRRLNGTCYNGKRLR